MDIIDEKLIPIDQCVNRKLYRVQARNIKIGVYFREPHKYDDGEWYSFYGIRTKFGKQFIDSEDHWDAKEFATCKPLEVIGELPEDIDIKDSDALMAWLETKEAELYGH